MKLQEENKRAFVEPSCEVTSFFVEDILTTSDWSGGEISPWVIEKP